MSTCVSVIGCGLMGSALARALNVSGHTVTACDLDTERLDMLAADGIETVNSAEQAFARSELIIINVPDHKAVDAVFDDVSPLKCWEGKTLVDLVSATPKGARAVGATVASKGAAYLDGAILAYPGNIGSKDAMILFSGRTETWNRFEKTLLSLGGASYHVSDEIGSASVLNVAMAGAFFIGSLAAFAEAAAYIRSQGLDLWAALAPAKSEALLVAAGIEEAIESIVTGNHETNQSTIDAFLGAAENWHDAMTESGQPATLMGAATATLRRAHDAGYGGLGFFAQVDTLGNVD